MNRDMLDPADPPSPLTAEELAVVRQHAEMGGTWSMTPITTIRRLLATFDAALASSPAPAGLDGHAHEVIRHTHNGTTHDHAFPAADPPSPLSLRAAVAAFVANNRGWERRGYVDLAPLRVALASSPAPSGLDETLLSYVGVGSIRRCINPRCDVTWSSAHRADCGVGQFLTVLRAATRPAEEPVDA